MGGPVSRIAVALSGGGHRALFSLGALVYLVDAGKSREVTSVSSVSGGSLIDRFGAGVEGMSGALVHIAQSPFRVPSLTVQRFPEGDERVAPAQAVLAKLGGDEKRRQEVVQLTRGVKTTLSKVGAEKATRLVEHGYMLALANLHVHLGYPLLDVPPPERFDALVRGGTGS